MKKLILEIDLNEICNLDCSYCILKKRNPSEYSINDEDVFKFVSNYIKHNRYTDVQLRFTSCEPTIILDKIIEYVEFLNCIVNSVSLTFITNAVDLEVGKLVKLSKLVDKVDLFVSIDEISKINQRFRKTKYGKHILTKHILQNSKRLEQIFKTKATYSSVIVEHTLDELKKQIEYFESIDRVNLMQIDSINNKITDKEVLDFVNKHKENNCTLACLSNMNRICIDPMGKIYMCRSQKTAGIETNYSIFDNNYDIKFDFSELLTKIYNKYGNIDFCPFSKISGGDLVE